MINDYSYDNLLKHPKWIRKRNKILKRDNYSCTVCGIKNNLQVHHTYYYKKNVAPWSYPDDSLLTLCDKCHHDYHYTHELTIVKNPSKKHFRKHKKKSRQEIKEPSNKSKLQAKHLIRPTTYKKKINGKWFSFEVKY